MSIHLCGRGFFDCGESANSGIFARRPVVWADSKIPLNSTHESGESPCILREKISFNR